MSLASCSAFVSVLMFGAGVGALLHAHALHAFVYCVVFYAVALTGARS